MICPFCESQIEDGLTLCPHCNAKIQQIPAAPETELTREDAPEAQEIPEAPAAPEAQAAAPVIPEPLWNPEPEAEAAAPEASLPQPEPPQEAAPVAERKRSPKRGLLIGLGCAALAAVVGLGAWFLSRRVTPAEKLERAAKNSLQALADYTGQLPNLNSIQQNLKGLKQAQTHHAELKVSETMSFTEDQTMEIQMTAKLDRDRTAGTVGGQIQVNAGVVELPVSFYGDKTQVQLGSSPLLKEQVLALPLENLPQRWNESALGKLIGLELPTGEALQELENLDLEGMLSKGYGEDWTRFRASLQVAEYEGTPHFSGEGVSYSLNWDQSSLDAMHAKSAKTLEELKNGLQIESPAQLIQLIRDGKVADLLVEGLWQLSDRYKAPQFYVEKELLTGIYVEDQKGESYLEYRLLGEENPWTLMRGTLRDSQQTAVGEQTMTVADGQLRIKTTASTTDNANPGQSGEPIAMAVVYNDADGKISYELPQLDQQMTEPPEMEMWLVPAPGGLRFTAEMEVGASFSGAEGKVREEFTLGDQIDPIAPLSQSPTDLLSLSQAELEALIRQISSRLMILE